MKRKYSDAFVDGQIAKIDSLSEKCREETPLFPAEIHEILDSRPYLNKQFNKVLKHRYDLAYIKGFWYGWSLRDGAKE